MVNAAVQGKTYPATEPYLVGREKVREFASAVMSTVPIHIDVDAARAAGYADVVPPPTFPVLVQQRAFNQLLADPEAALDFSRVVHGDQRFLYTRPIVAGDELTATLTITQVKHLGGHAMVTATTEVTADDGEHVVTAISTLVVRGEESE